MNNQMITISCKTCGHQLQIASNRDNKLFHRISTASPSDLRRIERSLKCSNCGLKAARIGKRTNPVPESKSTRKEIVCKKCGEPFVPPNFELRSRIGICAPCKDLLIAKENEGKRFSSEPSPMARERTTPRLIENQWCSDSDWKKMRRGQYSGYEKTTT